MKKVQIIEKSCHREALKVERVRDYFEANGYELIPDNINTDPTNKYAFPMENLKIDPTADIIVLTTCGFTQEIEDGDFEALELIKKHKKKSALVILAGCIIEIAPVRVKKAFSGPNFNSKSYHELDHILGNVDVNFQDISEPNKMRNTEKYFIQIQEGCNNRCSFCAIWRTVGRNKSKPIAEVIGEFHKGLNDGCREFYLLGHCAGA
jgi:tRNA A37 methylthiotransferase MiaB